MKVLFVASINNHAPAPFIQEQAEALRRAGCDVEIFGVSGKGVCGYLSNVRGLKAKINEYSPDVIHAHYGLCGLLATLQTKVPVVTTYHGSDINDSSVRFFSRISIKRSRYNIFVSRRLIETVNPGSHYSIIPCGIDTSVFKRMDKELCRNSLGLDCGRKYVLFASSFDNEVKNPSLAQTAISLIPDVTLMELSGYTRRQVAQLLNAVDALLMTSHSEGSPQVVKEALACGCPVVSVDVGDVADMISCVSSCHLVLRDAMDIRDAVDSVLKERTRVTCPEEVLQEFDNSIIARRLIEIYNQL